MSTVEDQESKEENITEFDEKSSQENMVLESEEINTEERNVMKGDTIGETLYSAKWILNTLISLSNVYENGWNSSLEDDLCMLWDMTSEKDIVEFLLENDFLKMAEFTIKISEEPRLTEIIVGIIGNMCCDKKFLEALGKTDELVNMMLSLISSDDKETLIQVLRVLQAAMWDIQVNPQSLWLKKIEECKILGEAITFILKSSTSDELLSPCMDFVYIISEIQLPNKNNFFENIFDIDQLIFALSEAMNELVCQEECVHTEAQFKNIDFWMNIMFNIIKRNLLKFKDEKTDEKFEKISTVLLKILQPFKYLSNLNSIEDQCLICIQQCIKMVLTFQKNEMFPDSNLSQTVLQIMVNLKKVITENEFDGSNEDSKQLFDYILNYWIETLKIINKEELLKVLRSCDRETINSIIEIVNSYPNVPENCTDKLLEA